MICIDFYPPQPGRTNSLNLDFFAQGTLEKFGGAAEEFVDVGRLWIQRLPARKGKQTARQRRRALSAAHRISECAAERSVDGRLNRLMLSRFKIADHDHKEVVEIVFDASAQLANCFHLLRDGKLLLSSLKLLLSFTSFGDVSGYFRKADKLARIIPDCVNDDHCPKFGPVLANAPAFSLVFPCRGGCLKRPVRDVSAAVLLAVECAEVFADNFRLLVPFDPLCAGIPCRNPPARIKLKDCVIDDCFHQAAVAALTFQQGLMREPPFRYVPRNFCKTDKLAALVMDGINDDACPKVCAILANAPTFGVKAPRLAGRAKRLVGQTGLLIFASVKSAERLAYDFLGRNTLSAGQRPGSS